MKMKGMRTCIAVAVFAATALGVSTAHAVPTLRLTDGTVAGTVTITDGLAGDFNVAANVVTYIGSVGNFTINVSTGMVDGTPFIDLNSVDTSSLGGGTLDVLFSVDNLGVQAAGWSTIVGGTTAGTFTFSSFYDNSNALFGTAGALATLGPYTGGAFSGGSSNGSAVDNQYSITLDATIVHAAGTKTTSFNGAIDPVPEPATMVLLGSGLLGLAGISRRRKKT